MSFPSLKFSVAIVLSLFLQACDLEVIDDFSSGPSEGAPEACFTVDRTACTVGDCMLAFDAGCSDGATNYRWDFDGDGTFDREGVGEEAPNFTFNTAGTFTVLLVVENQMNQSDSMTLIVTVSPAELPIFAVTDPTLGPAGGAALLSDGNLLMAGGSGSNVYLLRVDSEGDITLFETYGTPGNVIVQDLIVLSDGTYVTVGSYFDQVAGESKSLYLRTSNAGIALNGPTFVESLENTPIKRVTELPDGTLVFGASRPYEFGVGDEIVLDFWSANLTSFFGTKTLRGSGESFLNLNDLESRDDGILVVGSNFQIATGNVGYFARLNLVGDPELGQPRLFDSASNQTFSAITRLGEDDYLMVGSISPGDNETLIVRTDASGNAAAGHPIFLERSGDQFTNGVSATDDEGFIIAGQDGNNAMLVKLDGDYAQGFHEPQVLSGGSGFIKAFQAPGGGYYAVGFRGTSLYYVRTNNEGKVE